MSINLGTRGITAIKKGATSISKVYKGNTLYWGGAEPVPTTPTNYIVFSSPFPFTVGLKTPAKYWDGVIKYSTDGANWSEWDGLTTLASGSANELYFAGEGNTVITGESGSSTSIGGSGVWKIEGALVRCDGNIESLLDWVQVMRGLHPEMGVRCFASMFCQESLYGTYWSALISAPKLGATNLASQCYSAMFYGCQRLREPPEVEAVTIADSSCAYMLQRCIALKTLPELKPLELANSCYFAMVSSTDQIKVSESETGDYTIPYRIPVSGTGQADASALDGMFDFTDGTFTGTPQVNRTYYLADLAKLFIGVEVPTNGTTITIDLETHRWDTDEETPPENAPSVEIYWGDGAHETFNWGTKQTSDTFHWWQNTASHRFTSYQVGMREIFVVASKSDATVVNFNGAYSEVNNINSPELLTYIDARYGAWESLYLINAKYATKLKVVYVGDNTLAEYAFRECPAITTLTFGNNAEIGSYAFVDCTSLGPNLELNAASIGGTAFCDCSGINKVWIRDTVEEIGPYIFDSDSYVGSLPISMIYCEADSKPSGWNYQWNYGMSGEFSVTWGQKTSPF